MTLSAEPNPLDREVLLARYGARYRWQVLGVISLGLMGAIMPGSSFVVAIPDLLREFGVDQADSQLVMTSFLVANTIAMLPAPWLIQRFGIRKCFCYSMALLAATSVLGAFSPNFVFLIVVRLLQGAGTGVLMPMASIVVMRLFEPKQQGRASGLNGMAVTLAPAIAPTIGGVLVDYFGWQSVSLMPLPLCLLAWFAALRFLPVRLEEKHEFDFKGLVLLAIMTVAWLGTVSSIADHSATSWLLYAWAAAVVLALGAFIQHARMHHNPLISLDVVARRRVAMGLIVSFALGMSAYGAGFLIPLYFQQGLGLSATRAGAALMPGAVALMLSFPVAGFLTEAWTPRPVLVTGMLLFTASWLVLGSVAPALSYGWFVFVFVFSRIGHGLSLTPLTQATLTDLRGPALGQAAAVSSYVRQLGGVFGIAALAAFVQWRTQGLGGGRAAIASAYAETFTIVAVLTLFCVAAAWQQGRVNRER